MCRQGMNSHFCFNKVPLKCVMCSVCLPVYVCFCETQMHIEQLKVKKDTVICTCIHTQEQSSVSHEHQCDTVKANNESFQT